MNTIQQITDLRIAGQLEQAYQMSEQLLAIMPNDRHARGAVAKCLKDLHAEACAREDVNKVTSYLRRLKELDMAQYGEPAMANYFVWDLRIFFDTVKKRHHERYLSVADSVFEVLSGLDFVKPNKYYSMLAEMFAAVKSSQGNQWLGFVKFMDWFGFDRFMEEDFKRVPLSQGRSIPALVDRVYGAYYKALMAQVETGRADLPRVDEFVNRLTALNQSHPEYDFTLYRKAKLQLALNRKEDALEAIRPFVKRKQSEFWVWDVLSDTVEDTSIRLSCLCRALCCRTEPNYLVRVHVKMAKVMHQLGLDGNARREISQAHQLYETNGWRIPAEVMDMERQSWYQAAQAPESNADFYRAHLADSEAFLYINDPEEAVLISKVNRQKQLCYFITADGHRGLFSTKRLKGAFRENEVYLVRLESETQSDKPVRLLTHKKVRDVSPYVGKFFIKIEGQLKHRAGCDFAFVGDIYVGKPLLAGGLSDGMRVTGTAVKSFNAAKQTWGWRAVSLRPA